MMSTELLFLFKLTFYSRICLYVRSAADAGVLWGWGGCSSASGELRLQQGVPFQPQCSRVSVPVPQETPSPPSQAHRLIKGISIQSIRSIWRFSFNRLTCCGLCRSDSALFSPESRADAGALLSPAAHQYVWKLNFFWWILAHCNVVIRTLKEFLLLFQSNRAI